MPSKAQKTYWVYVLWSDRARCHYIGVTEDLEARCEAQPAPTLRKRGQAPFAGEPDPALVAPVSMGGQNMPTTWPFSSRSTSRKAGREGRPGMVRMVPQRG